MNSFDVQVTAAHIADVPAIVALVERFAKRGEVLPRPSEEVYQTLREWVVARQGDRLVGCASLVILWADLAEIRSLVVSPDQQGKGVGRHLVTTLMHQVAELEIPQVFALTRKPGFFAKLGFHPVARETLPRKIWKDCIHCIKFVGCDEVAFVQDVAVRPALHPAVGVQMSVPAASGNGHT
jgi:amino-acid N-acetyltransferase